MPGEFHIPVLGDQVDAYMQVKPGKWYIDATLGGGGHSKRFLAQGGNVLGIDQDKDAITYADNWGKPYQEKRRLIVTQGNFRNIAEYWEQSKIGPVQGILFDLGMSSFQMDQSNRGFRFSGDEPLDMRMDLGMKTTAFDVVNQYSEDRLCDIFSRFGEEPHSRLLSRAIVRARSSGPIRRTKGLTEVLTHTLAAQRVSGYKSGYRDVCARIFQALRIEVNNELEILNQGLRSAFSLLAPSGRFLVISFHSLEDRIVKTFFSELADHRKATLLVRHPVVSSFQERHANSRSRSAKLRVIERV